MDWLQIGLATLAAIVPSFTAFGIIVSLRNRRLAGVLNASVIERERAECITAKTSVGLIHLVQLTAGLAAITPGLALAWAIFDPTIGFPSLASLPGWTALYVVGWSVFGWCTRITDAL